MISVMVNISHTTDTPHCLLWQLSPIVLVTIQDHSDGWLVRVTATICFTTIFEYHSRSHNGFQLVRNNACCSQTVIACSEKRARY